MKDYMSMSNYAMLAITAVILSLSCKEKEEEFDWKNAIKDQQGNAAEYKLGSELPGWSTGYLDIHAICTGRGECIFYIMPDGTTMVVDAGEIVTVASSVPQKPSDNVRPSATMANYINHFKPKDRAKVDYMLLTHFHEDHMGAKSAGFEGSGDYVHTGVGALYDGVRFAKILDRGYPGYYDDASILPPESLSTSEYLKFIRYAQSQGTRMERFLVGEKNQICMTGADASKYASSFSILNITGNGAVVAVNSSTGGLSVSETAITEENPASCGFHLQYGKFDYIACGDLTSAPQNKMAKYVNAAISHLEAFKSNHHLNSNSWGSQMIATGFAPDVVISESFVSTAPYVPIVERELPGKDFYFTSVHPDAVRDNKTVFDRCKAVDGHIVIRVAPGGGQFMVYVLGASDSGYKIKSINGPYVCR